MSGVNLYKKNYNTTNPVQGGSTNMLTVFSTEEKDLSLEKGCPKYDAKLHPVMKL